MKGIRICFLCLQLWMLMTMGTQGKPVPVPDGYEHPFIYFPALNILDTIVPTDKISGNFITEQDSISLPFSVTDTILPTLDPVSVYAQRFVDFQKAERKAQQRNTALVRIISKASMELSTDITVADMLQRVGGVAGLNDHTGSAAFPVIRGLSPKYSLTTINGISIPSPDPSKRFLSLDLFPSEIAGQVNFYKSLTPEMPGNAIGGLIDIATIIAPAKSRFSVNMSGGYHERYLQQPFTGFGYQNIQQKSPYEKYGADYYALGKDFSNENLRFHNKNIGPDFNGSLLWSHRFLGQKLGVAISSGYQSIHAGDDGILLLQNSEPQVNNKAALTDYILRRYDNLSIRKHAFVAMDYHFNPSNHLTLSGLYLQKKDIETRLQTDTSLAEGRSGPGTGRISITQRSRLHDQKLTHMNLAGVHHLSPLLELSWNAIYSKAIGSYPDWAELGINTGSILGAAGNIEQTPELLAPLNRIWLHNTETEKDLKYTLHYRPHIFGQSWSIAGGGFHQFKHRDNFYNNYSFMPALVNHLPQLFQGIDSAVWLNNNGPQNPQGTVHTAGTYTATEDIQAYFATLGSQHGKFGWLGGIRTEFTSQNIITNVTTNSPYGKMVKIQYKDLLPSLYLKYDISSNREIRISYYKAISRPSLYDLTFFNMEYEDYNIAGNPFLKRSKADNIDLSYTIYKSDLLDYFQATAFYKKIHDPYERTLLNTGDTLYPISQNGLPYIPAASLTQQLRNYDAADNYGTEWILAKTFGQLKITASYTLSFSRIHQLKKYKTRVDPVNPASDIATISKYESRPLEGQSRNLADIQLGYTMPKPRLSLQLTAAYVGKRIHEVSGWYGLDEWQKATTALNLSLEKYLQKHWRIYAKASNLLDAGREIYIKQGGANPPVQPSSTSGTSTLLLIGRDSYKRQFLVGISYKL